MRTIKYRGKRLDNGEWVYGDLKCYADVCIIGIYTFDITKQYKEYRVDPDTVGQFTGLFDKNGKEIWEGDIISSGNNAFKHEIEWKEDICGFNIPSWGYYEVIGNIHDNPELLK